MVTPPIVSIPLLLCTTSNLTTTKQAFILLLLLPFSPPLSLYHVDDLSSNPVQFPLLHPYPIPIFLPTPSCNDFCEDSYVAYCIASDCTLPNCYKWDGVNYHHLYLDCHILEEKSEREFRCLSFTQLVTKQDIALIWVCVKNSWIKCHSLWLRRSFGLSQLP